MMLRIPFFPDLSRACARLADSLDRRGPLPRRIGSRDGSEVYLSRYYLLGAPPADLDEHGNPTPAEESARREYDGRPRVFLHRFHQSDADNELHSHPWRWAIAIVLGGGYTEERREPSYFGPEGYVRYYVKERTVRPGSIHLLRADDYHRVELLAKESWSLFIAGPKESNWYFWDRITGIRTPWREFLAKRQNGKRTIITSNLTRKLLGLEHES